MLSHELHHTGILFGDQSSANDLAFTLSQRLSPCFGFHTKNDGQHITWVSTGVRELHWPIWRSVHRRRQKLVLLNWLQDQGRKLQGAMMGDHMMPHHLFDMPLEASENIGDQKLLLLKALAEVRVSLASFIRRFRSQLFPIQFVLVGIALWKVQCVIGTRQFSILPSMGRVRHIAGRHVAKIYHQKLESRWQLNEQWHVSHANHWPANKKSGPFRVWSSIYSDERT